MVAFDIKFIGFVLVIVGLSIYFYQDFQKKRRGMRGPFIIPFIGQSVSQPSGTMTINQLIDFFNVYGDTYYTKRMTQGVARTREPAIIKHMCVTQFDKYKRNVPNKTNGLFDVLKTALFGDGIFGADGESWQLQRKLAIPMFKKHSLDNMKAIFAQKADIVMDILSESAKERKPVEIASLFFKYTLDSFGLIGFGFDINSLRDETVQFPYHFDRAQRMFVDILSHPLSLDFFEKKKNFFEDVDYLYDFFDRTLRDHPKDGEDLLSKFSNLTDEQGNKFPVKWLREILMNFAIAGRDTTAMLLTWSLFSLMKNPRVLAKLEKEIESGKEVAEMAYLELVLKETLRLYPSVPHVSRTPVEDDVLPNGMKVMAGERLSYSILAIHRDPRYWDQPDEFIPERWENPNVLKDPFQYVPFHMGKMQCLGMHMAQIEAKIILVRILKKFNFRLVPNQKLGIFIGIILTPEGGLYVDVTEK